MASSTFRGDDSYVFECTGDACQGDHVAFERAIFTGSFRNAKFAGFEMIRGEIVADSYGGAKQQHTFTIRLENGETLRIKGRNLYANTTWRKPWPDEVARRAVLVAKHKRGDAARAQRETRRADR